MIRPTSPLDFGLFLPPDDDPVYRRERVCIEAAKQESVRCGFELGPPFAPSRSFFHRLRWNRNRDALILQVPVSRTIDSLWRTYRPLPWSEVDNRAILLLWINVLYSLNEVKMIEITSLIDGEVDPDPGEAVPWSLDAPLITRRERWQYVAERLTGILPKYG